MAELTQKEIARREKLQREKPRAREKILKYPERMERGECCAIVEILPSFACNLHCKHCSNAKFTPKDRKMTLADWHSIAVQCDEIGIAQFNISGGEPLIFKDLDALFAAIMPEKFHISMSTNGMFLDAEKAKHLKKIGLDKIRISVDSIDEAKNALNRGNSTQFKCALEALENAKNAGLDATIQHCLTHQSVHEENFIKLLEYATQNDFIVDILPARAVGEWKGRYDLLLTDADGDFIRELHKKYPVIRWDMIPTYGQETACCRTVNGQLHITPYGDVLPCIFIQVTLGNVLDEPLKNIIDRGFNIRWFKAPISRCLSGMDMNFIQKYLSKVDTSKILPADYKDIFTAKDFIDPAKENL